MKQEHWIWDILTMTVLTLTVGMALWFVVIFVNPATPLNPLPQPTLPATAVLPSATATFTPQPSPTQTPQPSPTPTLTATPTPLSTIVAATPVTEPPTATPTAQYSYYPFVPQGDPQAIEAALVHPAEGCAWQGVAGQVFNTHGAPVLYMGVLIGGRYNGRDIHEIILTGYGPDYVQYGYEYRLGEQPLDSENMIWVRLVDQSFLPLSDKVYLNTFSECKQNLILLNFKQIK